MLAVVLAISGCSCSKELITCAADLNKKEYKIGTVQEPAPIDFTLQYSEQKDETTLEYACELIEENYLEKGDGLSMSILRNSAKSISCTKGLIKIVI